LKNSNLCDHNSPTSQTDRQTTCDRNTALCTKVHRAVKTDDGQPSNECLHTLIFSYFDLDRNRLRPYGYTCSR